MVFSYHFTSTAWFLQRLILNFFYCINMYSIRCLMKSFFYTCLTVQNFNNYPWVLAHSTLLVGKIILTTLPSSAIKQITLGLKKKKIQVIFFFQTWGSFLSAFKLDKSIRFFNTVVIISPLKFGGLFLLSSNWIIINTTYCRYSVLHRPIQGLI